MASMTLERMNALTTEIVALREAGSGLNPEITAKLTELEEALVVYERELRRMLTVVRAVREQEEAGDA